MLHVRVESILLVCFTFSLINILFYSVYWYNYSVCLTERCRLLTFSCIWFTFNQCKPTAAKLMWTSMFITFRFDVDAIKYTHKFTQRDYIKIYTAGVLMKLLRHFLPCFLLLTSITKWLQGKVITLSASAQAAVKSSQCSTLQLCV